MDDVIQLQDRFYILATSSLLQERRHVLKDADSFAVFDTQGDIAPFGAGEQGYFHGGTRHLSAAQFVYDQKGAVALVASQDGRFTVFAWSPCEERVHAHRVEALLL